MVDAIYGVHHGGRVVEVSVRSWSDSMGARSRERSFGFDSRVAVHAMDFLHSVSSVPLTVARGLIETAIEGEIASPGSPAVLVVGDIRCELWSGRGAAITIATQPSNLWFEDLHAELFITSN
ncbi:hypothetical protein B7R23_10320 [Subtercola boreus]|nr:hypothetical protein B7R23_10320 [Subtercola boreus]